MCRFQGETTSANHGDAAEFGNDYFFIVASVLKGTAVR
jgi:hypothetical protein